MGRWLMALLLVMLSSLATKAAEAYACYTSSNTTLTFYYDNQRSSRTGKTYDLNTDINAPGWFTDNTYRYVNKVVFNSSFANAHPTSTFKWFGGMSKLTSITGLSYLNTENVTVMGAMFMGCTGLTSIDLSNFNTANVKDMGNMFDGCAGLMSLDVTGFNTANVKAMGNMFYGCTGLTSLDVTGFNTANVTTMRSMFSGCTGLTRLDLSNFNTAEVTNMIHMFMGCSNLTTIYAGIGWTTNAVTTSTAMFRNCTSLVGGMGTTFDANHVDAAYAHIDGGTSNPGYFTEKGPEAYACYTPANTTLTFYYDNQRSSRPGTTYDLNEGSNEPGWYNDLYDQSTGYIPTTRVVFDPSFANARPTSTCCWFSAMECVESIEGIEYLNTSEVTNMSFMFYWCFGLTSLDLSNFNTAKVTNMEGMFSQCRDLTSLDLSNFNTAKVTNMEGMFYYCMSLMRLDLSSFNTAKVTDMGYMFYGCKWLTSLDVSSFNTAKVTNMKSMFKNCNALNYIYADNGWSTAAVTSSDLMFDDCFSLVGGKGTTYDENHVDATRAHIDGGPSNPGYFTDVNAPRAYACYTPGNTTLTFYYDDQCSSRPGTTYDLVNEAPGWYYDLYDQSTNSFPITRVVFDPSFAGARPTSTYGWFAYMVNLESIEGIGYLNTSEVTNMIFMFNNCSGLTSLDLSSFNTANVTIMYGMFQYCSNLRTIYVSDSWSTAAVLNSDFMFDDCTSLVGGMGTTYDENYMDAARAHIDGGPSNPGYFTGKSSFLRGDVNGDGQVKISDVTALINYLLSGDASAINLDAADCNQNGEIKIADVTALINYLLSGTWN